MLEAAKDARRFAAGRARADLETNRMLSLALVKSIEIIGEAGTRVSEQGRRELPEVPWAEIVAMRHRLIHAYYDVDLDVVWETVERDLPPLIATLERAAPAEG
jgi:uncharacterized protein with HEPN domain